MIDWGFRGNQLSHDDWPKYDLLGQAELLADEGQKDQIERAIRSQAFRFAVYCPHMTTLESKRTFTGYSANYCEDNLRITAVLFYDFHWRHSISANLARKKANTKRKQWLFANLSEKPGSEAVRSALHLRHKGLRPLIDGVTTGELTTFWEMQSNKSKATATILDGYMRAGAAIRKGGRAPYGLSIMVEALVGQKKLDRAARTAEAYYAEMKSAAVMHYLIHMAGMHDELGPVCPTEKSRKEKDFVIRCMDSSLNYTDARKIFISHNVVATYLNRFFGFRFALFPVRYSHDHYLPKDRKAKPPKFVKENQELAARIKAIIGRST